MCKYRVIEEDVKGKGCVYGVASETLVVSGLTCDRLTAEKLVAMLNEEDLAPEHLKAVAEDFARDPQFFLKCIQG